MTYWIHLLSQFCRKKYPSILCTRQSPWPLNISQNDQGEETYAIPTKHRAAHFYGTRSSVSRSSRVNGMLHVHAFGTPLREGRIGRDSLWQPSTSTNNLRPCKWRGPSHRCQRNVLVINDHRSYMTGDVLFAVQGSTACPCPWFAPTIVEWR